MQDNIKDTYTFKDALSKLEEAMSKRADKNYYISKNFEAQFDMAIVSNQEWVNVETTIHRFTEKIGTTLNRDLRKRISFLDKIQSKKNYYQCGLVQAMVKMADLIELGELDELNNQVMIILSNKERNNRLSLAVYRYQNGKLALRVQNANLNGGGIKNHRLLVKK